MSEVFLPASLEALWMLLEKRPGAVLMAGGTDLLVRRRRHPSDADIVCLERIEYLRGVTERDGRLCIGAATPLSLVADHPLVANRLPVLSKSIRSIGGPPIRNTGTIGGNVCSASPAGDSLPALSCLDALVEILSGNERRSMPVAEFIEGPGKIRLAPGEVVAALLVPLEPTFAIHHFEKVGLRASMAISVASLAACIDLDAEGSVRRARLALGSVGPTVIRPNKAEDFLLNKRLSPDILAEAARLVRETVAPITDLRASAAYRREVAGNLLLRLSDPATGALYFENRRF